MGRVTACDSGSCKFFVKRPRVAFLRGFLSHVSHRHTKSERTTGSLLDGLRTTRPRPIVLLQFPAW